MNRGAKVWMAWHRDAPHTIRSSLVQKIDSVEMFENREENKSPYPPQPHIYHQTSCNNSQILFGNGHKDYEWGVIMFIASLGMVFIITLTVYCMYFSRLRQVEGRPMRSLRIPRARRFSWRAAEDYFWTLPTEGLRRAIVDALPVFVYRPESFKDGLRCAVCLCEFQENDKARILPGCNHSFHVDCIDMWFHSHSTCPLCRASVDAQSVELGLRQTEVSVIEEGGGGEKRDSVAAEPVQNEYLKQNNDERKKVEEGSRSDVVIDIPTS